MGVGPDVPATASAPSNGSTSSKDPRRRRQAAATRPEEDRRLDRGAGTGVALLWPSRCSRKTKRNSETARSKLANAGFRSESAGTVFLGLKFAGLVAGPASWAAALVTALRRRQSKLADLVDRRRLACCFYLPDLVVWFLGRRRKQAIFLALPDALDLMVVCVEAGLGLDQAMRKVADEMKRDLPRAGRGVRPGELPACRWAGPRPKCSTSWACATAWPISARLAAMLIQADQFGSSIAQALRMQSDSMRTRRRQIGRREGRQDRRATDLPAGAVHLPRHLRGPGRPGGHQHGPPDVHRHGQVTRAQQRVRRRHSAQSHRSQHRPELAEEIIAVVRAGRGLGMILNAEGRQADVA